MTDLNMTVKTTVGQTNVFILEDIEMQDTVNAPLKCIGQIDSLGRNGYTIRMIDDTLGMSLCGADSVELKAFLNTTMES